MAFLDPINQNIDTLTTAVDKLVADVAVINTELQAALAAEDQAGVNAAAAKLAALTAVITTTDQTIQPPAPTTPAT